MKHRGMLLHPPTESHRVKELLNQLFQHNAETKLDQKLNQPASHLKGRLLTELTVSKNQVFPILHEVVVILLLFDDSLLHNDSSNKVLLEDCLLLFIVKVLCAFNISYNVNFVN